MIFDIFNIDTKDIYSWNYDIYFYHFSYYSGFLKYGYFSIYYGFNYDVKKTYKINYIGFYGI